MNLDIIAVSLGQVSSPPALSAYSGGPSELLSNIVRTAIALAAVYSLFNFILAGYTFLSAGDDPKKIQAGWAKIWQTMIGLTVVAGVTVLSGVFGQILFDDPTAFLRVVIWGPGV